MRKLTDKQLNFCAEYVNNGGNGLQAYKLAYEQDNIDICKAEAYNLLKKKTIQNKIHEEELDYRITGHGLGINKEVVLKVIGEAMQANKLVSNCAVKTADGKINIVEDVPDYTSRLKAIEVYAKLVGDFAPEKKMDVTDQTAPERDISKMTPEEIEAYKAEILAEL